MPKCDILDCEAEATHSRRVKKGSEEISENFCSQHYSTGRPFHDISQPAEASGSVTRPDEHD
jgi:K+-transporting ATPase c subunit